MEVDILDRPFYSDDLNRTTTLRGYFKAQLQALWEEGDGFSGKRPLGNSGWEFSVAEALGYSEKENYGDFFQEISEAIENL